MRLNLEPFVKWPPAYSEDLKFVKLVDIKTSKVLKAESGVVADAKGNIGDVIMPLEPSLWRVGESNGDVKLRQGIFLIQLKRPLLKRKADAI